MPNSAASFCKGPGERPADWSPQESRNRRQGSGNRSQGSGVRSMTLIPYPWLLPPDSCLLTPAGAPGAQPNSRGTAGLIRASATRRSIVALGGERCAGRRTAARTAASSVATTAAAAAGEAAATADGGTERQSETKGHETFHAGILFDGSRAAWRGTVGMRAAIQAGRGGMLTGFGLSDQEEFGRVLSAGGECCNLRETND